MCFVFVRVDGIAGTSSRFNSLDSLCKLPHSILGKCIKPAVHVENVGSMF